MANFFDGVLESLTARLIVNFLISVLKKLHIILLSMLVTVPIYIFWISKIYPHIHPHAYPPIVQGQVTLIGFSCQYNNADNKHYCDFTSISGDNPPPQSCSIKDDAGKEFGKVNYNESLRRYESKKKISVDNPQEHIIFDCGEDFKISIAVAKMSPVDELQKGIDAYNEGNYNIAHEIFEKFVEGDKDYARAQNYIGNLYRYGHGVVQSYEKAVKFYEISADKGDRLGQHNLAHRHQFGQGGLPEDCDKAMEWFQKAWYKGDQGAGKHFNDLYLDCY